jgi:hypothetical protein
MDQIPEARSTTMAERVSMALAELVREAEQQGDVDFLREEVRVLSQALMEVEVSQQLGDGRHERRGEQSGYSERRPRAGLGQAGGHARPAGAAGAGRRILPEFAGAAQAGRGPCRMDRRTPGTGGLRREREVAYAEPDHSESVTLNDIATTPHIIWMLDWRDLTTADVDVPGEIGWAK